MTARIPFQNHFTPIDEFEQCYRLVQHNPIAEGKLGRVYAYMKKKTGEKYAVQMMPNLDRQTRFYLMEEIRTCYLVQREANYILKTIDLIQEIHPRKGALETYSITLIMEQGISLLQLMKQQQHDMTMKEVLYHLKTITKIIVKLHSSKLYHGNLKPQNIFYVEESNVIGIKSKKMKLSGFFNTKKGQKNYTPYTPQDLVSSWKNYDKINGNYLLLGDIYSLGMIIVCMCLNKHKVLEDRLNPEQLLDNLKIKVDQKLYSNDLFLLLKDMVDEDPEKRPGFKDLQDRLKLIEQRENFPEDDEDLKVFSEESSYIQSLKDKKQKIIKEIESVRKYTVDKCNNKGTHGQTRKVQLEVNWYQCQEFPKQIKSLQIFDGCLK